MTDNGGNKTPLNSPLRVLGKITAILDAFSLSRPVLTLGDIKDATDMPTSTVQRLASNLVAQGFLDRDGDEFRIGMNMAYWAAPAARGVPMLNLIGPSLKSLRDTTGETTCFFRLEGRYRVCVAMEETTHSLRREMHVGKILPLHAGSAGHMILAYTPELIDEVTAGPLESLTEHTITDPTVLAEAVSRARRDGYSITIGHRDDAGSGLSAPVFDSNSRLLGALNISGPRLRMSRETCEGWLEDLLATAEQMTRLVGGRFPEL